MRKSSWAGLLAGLFVLSIVLVACGGDEGGGGATATGGGATATGGGATATGGASGNAIVIEGFAFNPSTIALSGPTDVTITNNDSASHTFTTDDGSIDQEIGSGETVTVTVDVPDGTGFHCRFHTQMTGTIKVG